MIQHRHKQNNCFSINEMTAPEHPCKPNSYHMCYSGKYGAERKHMCTSAANVQYTSKMILPFLACPGNIPYVDLKRPCNISLPACHITGIPRMTKSFKKPWKLLKTHGVVQINVVTNDSEHLSPSLLCSLAPFNWVSVMMVSVSGLSSSIFASVIPTRPWREGFPCSAVPVSQWNIPS